MSLVQLECVQYGHYYVNPANITFVSCGEEIMTESGSKAFQIFIHFTGGKESAMLMVSDVDEAFKKLNS